MRAQLLQLLITTLLTFLTEDLMKKFADTLLDFIEDFVAGTASSIDDKLILPLCARLREAFNVPDNDPIPDEQPPSGLEDDDEDEDEDED